MGRSLAKDGFERTPNQGIEWALEEIGVVLPPQEGDDLPRDDPLLPVWKKASAKQRKKIWGLQKVPTIAFSGDYFPPSS